MRRRMVRAKDLEEGSHNQLENWKTSVRTDSTISGFWSWLSPNTNLEHYSCTQIPALTYLEQSAKDSDCDD
jgi:hypothetical protein